MNTVKILQYVKFFLIILQSLNIQAKMVQSLQNFLFNLSLSITLF